MASQGKRQKTVVVGAGPVGALAAIYAAQRGHDVEIYELRSGTLTIAVCCLAFAFWYHGFALIIYTRSSLVSFTVSVNPFSITSVSSDFTFKLKEEWRVTRPARSFCLHLLLGILLR